MAVIFAALAGLLGGPAGVAQSASLELMPGVTYQRQVENVRGKQVVVHVVTGPRPGGLYRLVPVLSSGTVLGRETVTSMQRVLASQATVVGVNGDYSSFEDGHPSGMFMTGGVLDVPPLSFRSSLGISEDGTLRVARVGFYGTWALGDANRTRLDHFHRAVAKGEVGLFNRAWGPTTPRKPGSLDILVEGIDAALPNVDLAGTVVSVERGGGTSIPPLGAVIQARGAAAAGLEALAQPGVPLVVRLGLKPWWDDVAEGIGGGPALVQDGGVALPTTEGFTAAQLVPSAPRTAVGQLADGRIVFVVVDGRRQGSAGMTMRDLAEELDRRGAVTAMSLDGGGSSTLALNGQVLNTPSDGGERPIGDALMLLYFGAYALPPRFAVVSPNGDGVADQQRLSWKIVRNSTVTAQLIGPDRQVAWQQTGELAPGTYRVPASSLATLAEGRWRFAVQGTDDEGEQSQASRAFSVNNTLGRLSLSARALNLSPKRATASLGIQFQLAHTAQLHVVVQRAGGAAVRTLYASSHDPGAVSASWDGRDGRGVLVGAGTYVVRVTASNSLGSVGLTGTVAVKRSR